MEIAMDNSKAVPMTILTGFLGSGKTTLLNRLLNGTHGLRVAVLVNDFGAINIDAELVVGVESNNTINLSNGCVCCQIRDDLVESVEDLLMRPQPIEYIVLEASGVAEPGSLAMTFVDPKLRDRIRLDSITCVVDADQVFAYPEYPQLKQLKLRQIGFSDLVILNKVDLAGREQVEEVKAWIGDHMSRVRIVEARYCDVPYEILLAVGRFDLARVEDGLGHGDANDQEHEHNHAVDHGRMFSTWSYTSDRPFSLDVLEEMVRKLPGTIYRCKGVIYTSDAPERRAVLQVVGRRMDISLLDEWGGRTPRTQIVAIVVAEGIRSDELQARFDACISASVLVDVSK